MATHWRKDKFIWYDDLNNISNTKPMVSQLRSRVLLLIAEHFSLNTKIIKSLSARFPTIHSYVPFAKIC